MWVLRPTGQGRPTVPGSSSAGVQYLNGVVGGLTPLDCSQMGVATPRSKTQGAAPNAQCGQAFVRLDNSTMITVGVPPEVVRAGVGTGVVIMKVADQSGSPYSYYDIARGKPLVLLAILFCVVVAGVARWRGIRALIGLGLAFLVVGKFLLPALLEGHSPVALGLATSGAIMVMVLYLAHGVSARTTTALLGTMAGVLIIAGLGSASVAAAHLTGVSSDDNSALQQVAQQLDLSNLLTCGIILAGLGILNDVTITQSAAVWELWEIAPETSARQLYTQAMRIGRDHIASTVYTVVFAYAGAALPVLLLISIYDQPLLRTLTSLDIGEELVRTMAGGVGLVLSVPATTALAVLVVSSIRKAGTVEAAQSVVPPPPVESRAARHRRR
ncbi:YibE/F family protein [Nostocoides sp. HKS02]|uniref:YibE/F family protein n=1 Tax=Nostocoides sp. HKS02 TaxID=1813880 RepID=UPI0012B4EF33|nr:YibE/F family protein [Tetrasphaera sp. HKS02]QGN57344.1 YibE/F family protein [Tetrasphaera sp. HKS02]